MEEKINEKASQKKIIVNKNLVKKCIEFKSIMQVRHGIMFLGKSGSAKSTLIDLLSQCMDKKVKFSIINPKSVPINQLYGIFDSESKTWQNGIMSQIMREYAQMDES